MVIAARRFAAFAGMALLTSTIGCRTDAPSAVSTAPAMLAVRASAARTDASAGAAQVRITVAYLRQTGAPVNLGTPQLFSLDQTSQQVPVAVDLATCLSDPARSGTGAAAPAADECQVQLTLDFLVGGVRVDQQVLSNLSVRPGQTATVEQPVALAQVADVRLLVPAANQQGAAIRLERGAVATLAVQIIDANNQAVSGRTITWSSSDPTVATIDGTGVIRGVSLGTTQVIASVAGRDIATALTVVSPSRTISIVSTGSSGSGQVRSSPGGIDCTVQGAQLSGSCSAVFAGDVVVALGATPASGSAIAALAGDCLVTGTGACTVTDGATGGAARTVSVNFRALRALTVAVAGDGDGTVRATGATIDCQRVAGTTSGLCSDAVADGASVQLTAVPAAGSVFLGWTGDCTDAAGCTLAMTSSRAVTARFARLRTITIAAGAGVGTGTVSSQPAGIACTVRSGGVTGTCTATFASTTVVTLSATPDASSAFGYWSGPCTGLGSCTLTVTGDLSVGANFVGRRTLSVSLGGTGSGSVASSPGSIACAVTDGAVSGRCSDSFAETELVQLAATPAAGSLFLGWSGACAGSDACTVPMTAARNVTATFGRARLLTVSGAGAGSGSVSSAPAGVACTIVAGGATGSCSGVFASAVTLTATAAAGSEFVGWGGACSGTDSCVVNPSADVGVIANFRPSQVTLTVTVIGFSGSVDAGVGAPCTLTVADGGSSGSVTCTYVVAAGRVLTLNATPSATQQFGGWGGACGGTGACQLTMDGSRSVSARFDRRQVTITMALAGAGGGFVSGGGLSCSLIEGKLASSCSGTVPAGTALTLSASAMSGSTFSGWSGPCSGVEACVFTPTANTTVSAGFARASSTVQVSGDGTGVVALGGAGRCTIANGAQSGTCTTTLPFGQSLTLSVDPSVSFPFLGWSGACTGTALTCTIVGNGGPISVGARFQSP